MNAPTSDGLYSKDVQNQVDPGRSLSELSPAVGHNIYSQIEPASPKISPWTSPFAKYVTYVLHMLGQKPGPLVGALNIHIPNLS